MRSIIKYPGSKFRIADQIISYFPKHHTYLEPFFGSGAVLFNKKTSDIETVNNLDGDVVNFFRWVKNDPEKLAHEIAFTPYARTVYQTACSKKPQNTLEQAVSFCIRLNMGFGFRTGGPVSGWKTDIHGREKAYAANDWSTLPERLFEVAERLRGVQIECMQAVDLIKRYRFSDVLIYCDPPYLLETRSGGKQYRMEMEESEHIVLLQTLKEHPGPVLLSGYDSELYRDMLKDWSYVEIDTYSQVLSKKKEIIWVKYPPLRLMKVLKWGLGKRFLKPV